MDELAARRLATDAMLGCAFRGLSGFSLRALYLGCRRGRIPALVVASLDDGQVRLIGGLMSHPDGQRQIQLAIDAEIDLRTWGRMH